MDPHGRVDMSTALALHLPLATETLLANQDLVTGSELSLDPATPGLLVDLDVRRRDWRPLLGLPAGVTLSWQNVRTVEVQDLSALVVPLRYRVTFGEGLYRDAFGRHTFHVTDHLVGLDLQRRVSTVALRAAVLLAVLGGVGLRQVVWLLSVLFRVELSKSALDRWLVEAASHLPGTEQMVEILRALKPITEAHFDEIFPRGKKKKKPVLVVRDEHGRILVTEEVEHRDEEEVVRFLQKLKRWGLSFRTFYIDHCASYAKAIARVFPEATVQYDYFHILQNVWRTLWRAFVRHRKELKQRSEKVTTPRYAAKLEALAKRLWEHRGLLFKFGDLGDEEKTTLAELLAADPFLGTMRRFLERVRGIFRDSRGELGARQRLGRLKQRAEVTKPGPPTAFAKAVSFLSEHFEGMITFLRVPEVKRNSLAETGMRTLRRLEQGHDGFRTSEGRDRYVRLYQAIRYVGWDVQRRDGRLTLSRPAPH
jgi:hypothetical protein